MVSPQAASAVTVRLCAPKAAQIASVSRPAVRGERLAMRARTRALPADLSAVGVRGTAGLRGQTTTYDISDFERQLGRELTAAAIAVSKPAVPISGSVDGGRSR